MKPQPKFTFFDPHPGLMGCMSPIPSRTRDVANKLNGRTLTLATALLRITKVAPVGSDVYRSGRTIAMRWEPGGSGTFPILLWRVIRFKPVRRKASS